MILTILLAASLLAQPFSLPAQSSDPRMQTQPHYRIYDASGKSATLKDVVEVLGQFDVVCVGEMHNDPVAHVLEAELLRLAYERYGQGSDAKAKRPVTLSLEMFERDVQLVLDEYLAGLIIERHFLSSSRPWGNYQTDYRPLIEFARQNRIPVIAANAPARYVTRVSRLGRDSLEALSSTAKAWLPPLPYPPASLAYAAKFNQFMRGEMAPPQRTQEQRTETSPAPGMNPHAPTRQEAHGTSHLLSAQTLRDAAMGFSIAEHLKQKSEALVLHVNGRFHSEGRMGTPEHLLQYRPKTRVLVITIASDEGYPDFNAERMGRLGDFIILTDPQLPRTH
jgi:uncharacterized iron-regulated protein